MTIHNLHAPLTPSLRFIQGLLQRLFPVALLLWPGLLAAQVNIDPPTRTFAKEGGGYSILTSGSGSWTASTTAPWITITPRTSGTAGESCVYLIQANFSADTRQGVIAIADKQHTVTQTGYAATLSPMNATVDLEGGSGVISIAVDAGVGWSASSNVDWVTVSPTSGIGSGTVSYTVAPYNGVTTRTTALTVAGRTFSITQTGADVNIAPRSADIPYSSNIVQVQITALGGTTWTVMPSNPWISVVDPGNGFGDSTVTLAVGANPSFLDREGTVSIGSATFTILQSGTSNPVLDILPKEATADPVGAYGNVAVLATPDAPWTAESLDPWIVIADGASGAGNGNVQYVASANPNLSPRTGRIRVNPPVYQARTNLSWLLLAHINDSAGDLTGWSRDLSGSLSQTFNGTNPLTLTGQGFARDDDTFSVAFWFRTGEAGAIHRLFEATRAAGSYTTLYVDAADRLVVNCDGQTLITNLTVEPQVWYQLVATSDESNAFRVYAGKRGESISQVGAASFAVAPFPSYLRPEHIKLGGATQPSPGNLNNGRIDDLRIYGRTLNAHEAAKLFEVAGTSTPYGDFSYRGDPGNTKVEYVFQGSGLVASGVGQAVTLSDYVSPSGGNFTNTVWTTVYTHSFHGNYVELILSQGGSSGNGTTFWQYEFVYSDGTSATTDIRFSPSSTEGYIEKNPHPQKGVNQVLVKARRNSPSGHGWVSSSYIVRGAITSDRFGLGKRVMKASHAFLENLQNSFNSPHATYNFWVRLDSFPTEGLSRIFSHSGGISCSTLPNGHLRIHRQNVILDYDADLEIGRWHMITLAGTQNGSVRFYVDGEEIGNTSEFGNYVYGRSGSTRRSLVIGGWDGAIDYAGFYDGALSSAQIRAIYESQRPQTIYHTVTQGTVEPEISPQTVSVPPVGGGVSTSLLIAHNVNWTVEASVPWLTVTSPTTGAGPGTVEALAAANPTVYPRQGVITIGGRQLTVTQQGLNAEVSYDDVIFSTDGGSAWVEVSAEGNAQWQASSNVSWLTVAVGGSGAGAGSVFIVADPYTSTSSSRTGTVTIAGKTVYFTQRGYELSVSPQVAQIGSNAGAGEFGVAAPITAVWEAIVTQPWITIVGGTTGLGSGTVHYSIAANTTGQTRTGRILVAGQEYTITQAGSLLVMAESDGNGLVAGGGDYGTNAEAILTATPADGFVFSHWTGDAVGSANPLTLAVDSNKAVKAHFVPEEAAEALALMAAANLGLVPESRIGEERAAVLAEVSGDPNAFGLYNPDQIQTLALGRPLLTRNPESGKMLLSLGLKRSANLVDWSDLSVSSPDVEFQQGRILFSIQPQGNAQFYIVEGSEPD